nr:hypothetical protein [Tanacetum cinerariifolium]
GPGGGAAVVGIDDAGILHVEVKRAAAKVGDDAGAKVLVIIHKIVGVRNGNHRAGLAVGAAKHGLDNAAAVAAIGAEAIG